MRGERYRAITVGRVQAIEITLNWRWVPVLALATWLLAQTVLPARFPLWEVSTNWITSAAAVLAGEIALLLHELSHAMMARGRGQEVIRIVFHGLRAETIVAEGVSAPSHEAMIALVGPAMNVALAVLAQAVRLLSAAQGPVDVFLLTLVLGNVAMALMSLVPLSGSDGARALGALKRIRESSLPSTADTGPASSSGSGSGSGEAEVASQGHDQDDEDDQTER